MKTTNTLNILALLLSLLLFVGCEKDVNDEQLRVTPENIKIGCEGGTQQVDIESTSGWKVIVPSDCTWVKSDRYESEVGHRQWIKLTISKNNTEETRKATITIRNSGQSCNISIVQYKETYVETINGLNLKMIFVEEGTFVMGSNDGDSDERPVHNVTLDLYYIGETEVTQAQWQAIMGSNPSSYKGDNRPVENVSWNEAQEFCDKLSALTGKKYVLPTEAQWEYAARGGNKSNGYAYSGSNTIGDVAVYSGNRESQHSNVKSKESNELGIYDMSGNVYEWCSDCSNLYGNYSSSPQTNPQGPSSGSYRVLRGGSWNTDAGYCRVANRNYDYPYSRSYSYGFRVVCIP